MASTVRLMVCMSESKSTMKCVQLRASTFMPPRIHQLDRILARLVSWCTAMKPTFSVTRRNGNASFNCLPSSQYYSVLNTTQLETWSPLYTLKLPLTMDKFSKFRARQILLVTRTVLSSSKCTRPLNPCNLLSKGNPIHKHVNQC